MGGIIPAFAAPGQTIFTTFMSMSDAKIWNGSSMEVYSQSHWGNYQVSASEQAGSGRYITTIPSLPAGRYVATIYISNGGVGQDTPIDFVVIDWDGGNLIGLGSSLNVGQIAGSSSAATKLSVTAGSAVTGAAASGTLSTSQMTTNLSGTVANMYAGRVLIFTSGANAGFAVLITAYAVTGAKLTFIAYNNQVLPSAPLAGDAFVIL